MKGKEFGSRLRELREEAGLSQRELADRVEINFTYLSKIENGVMPPPSEAVILKLVEVLNADRDELLTAGGKVPSDITQILKDREVMQSLREGRTQKKSGVANERNGFGKRLKELREKTGLSQGELAGRIGVNFTYLSKIESGTKPAPSEKVILKLAEALNCDKDELLSSAEKVPPDIAQLLKNREVLQSLRESRTQKTISVAGRGKGFSIMKQLVNGKKLARLALPFILVCGVAASLWFSSPSSVRALSIAITDSQGQPLEAGTLGEVYNFSVNVTIEDGELLPIQSIDLFMINSANSVFTANVSGLPLVDGDSANYTSAQTGALSVNVTASAPHIGRLFGYGYSVWQGYAYTFPIYTQNHGYGYGYGYGGQVSASLTYDIAWTPPRTWPVGAYQIQVDITTISKTFTQTAEFTLAAASAPSVPDTGGIVPSASGASAPSPSVEVTPAPATPAPATPAPGDPLEDIKYTAVSDVITSDGVFTQGVTATSTDGNVGLAIGSGVTGLTKAGNPISSISVVAVSPPAAPPANAHIIGVTYDLGPDEATFDPPIDLTFTYNPTALPEDVAENELSISYWNGTEWEALKSTVDTAANTVTAKVSHLSMYAVMGRTAPAPPVVPPVAEPPVEVPVTPTNWGLIGGIIAAVIVIGVLVYFFWWRRRPA